MTEPGFRDIGVDELDELLIDPEIREILLELVAMSKVNEFGFDQAEAYKIMMEFDARFKEMDIKGEEATLSGTAMYPIKDTEDFLDELITQQVSDLRVRLRGFSVLPVDDPSGGVMSKQNFQVVMAFEELFDNDGVESSCVMFMKPHDLSVLEMDSTISLAHAENMISYYLPYIKEQIDTLIDESDDELDAVDRFMSFIADIVDDSLRVRLTQCLNKYIEFNLLFDCAPYVLGPTKSDGILLDLENGSLKPVEIETTGDTIMMISKLVLLKPLSDTDETEGDVAHLLVPYLDCSMFGDQKYEPGSRLLMPLILLGDVRSMRDIYSGDASV